MNMVMSRSGMVDNMSSSMVNWMVDGVGRVNRMVDRVNGVDWVDNRYSSNFYFNFARSLFYINNSNWLDYCWSRSKVESWKGSWNWEGGNWSNWRLRGQDNRLGYPSSKSSSKSKWNGSSNWSRRSKPLNRWKCNRTIVFWAADPNRSWPCAAASSRIWSKSKTDSNSSKPSGFKKKVRITKIQIS